MAGKSREAEDSSPTRSCLMRKLGPGNLTRLSATFKGMFFKLLRWDLTKVIILYGLRIQAFSLVVSFLFLLFHPHHLNFFLSKYAVKTGERINSEFTNCWHALKIILFFFNSQMFSRPWGQRTLSERSWVAQRFRASKKLNSFSTSIKIFESLI